MKIGEYWEHSLLLWLYIEKPNLDPGASAAFHNYLGGYFSSFWARETKPCYLWPTMGPPQTADGRWDLAYTIDLQGGILQLDTTDVPTWTPNVSLAAFFN